MSHDILVNSLESANETSIEIEGHLLQIRDNVLSNILHRHAKLTNSVIMHLDGKIQNAKITLHISLFGRHTSGCKPTDKNRIDC